MRRQNTGLRGLLVAGILLGLLSDAGTGAQAHAGEPPLRRIGFLVLPGVYNSELMAPYDILHHLRFHVPNPPEVFTVAPKAGPITTFEGLVLTPRYTFADAPPIDLLIVPSAEHNLDSDLRDQALIGWVRERGGKARWVMSLCDGAFVLAQAGLLKGLWATTFPGDQEALAQRFGDLKLKREVLFIHDGKAITSVGGARSYEPALYLVERLYGREVARRIARGVVIDWNLAALSHWVGPDAR